MASSKMSFKIILAVVAAGIMSFAGVVIETSMNITFPTLMQEFGINTSTVQWMTTIYLLVVSIVIPLSAILKRNFKTKNLFITANLLFILGIGLDIVAPNFSLLLLGRVVQGMGTGIALPLMFNIILEQVPESKIGLMMGVGNLITAIAPAVGPTFGGVVVSSIGWRYIFVILLPLLVLSLLMGLFAIEQKSEINKAKFDLISLMLIMVTFLGLVIGFSSMGDGQVLSLKVILPIIVGILGMIILYQRSTHIENPIVNLNVLKNKGFAGHVLVFFILQFETLGLSFILPNYIQIVNHKSATIAGLVVLPGAVIGALFAPFSGKILDNLGPKPPMLSGLCFGVISLILFVTFSMHLSDTLVLIFYVVYMICIGLSFGNFMTNGLKQLKRHENSDGNAVFTTVQQISGAIATSIISAVITISQVSHKSLGEVGSTALGSKNALIVLLVLIVIAALVTFKMLVFKKSAK
ncbi:DHA2 family efflux MFS transporter permease subunit [Apilactobacillus ozensis]|uniref:DHA2 family efflux MFS transporter permease subunit n=1 Tax=Apilactobacillus ozensis TaxID=866801 RepID=UPI00200ACBB0|nr:DHA2 family efflux MFS transporter permease subunit [Apilactobacillus ozensis]MCK8606727.1 DHA2 family efflux MFS transporter permease subunit [Apilactobacillus ozensis]